MNLCTFDIVESLQYRDKERNENWKVEVKILAHLARGVDGRWRFFERFCNFQKRIYILTNQIKNI
jgi:hypothetical protein